jgi:hypothetical protein
MPHKITNIENITHNELKLQIKPSNITIIDNIKLLISILNNRLENITNNVNKTELEKYYLNLILHHYSNDFLCITTNYYNNLLLEWYFILGNVFLFDDPIFDILLENKDYLLQIPELTEKLLEKTYNSKLRKFYNNIIMNKWKEILDFKKYDFENYKKIINGVLSEKDLQTNYNKYLIMWDLFESCVNRIKIITDKYVNYYININNSIPGCTNINKDFYYYCIHLNTGLDIRNIGFKKIFLWGYEEYKKIKKLIINIIDKLHPEIKYKTYQDKIKFMSNNSLYKFKSKKNFIDEHHNELNKIKKLIVDKYKIPLLKEAKIIDFDDKNMAGGYWFRDAFYLNTTNWKDTETFSTKALVLHETIPGHHLQLSYETHANSNPTLFGYWFPIILNGNAEGWALFSEKIADTYTDLEMLGVLTYNMLRTLRIIADISIHYIGIEPEKIIDIFKKNLIMNEKSIRSEVYRYVCLPGQALCYKFGDLVIRKIFVNKFNRTDNLLADDTVKFYKEFIMGGMLPLELLCNKYNININNLFN